MWLTHLVLKGAHLMSSILYRINGFLSRVVAEVPIGTNLGLFHLLWMLLSGRLLQSRGAVIPGLTDFGLAAAAARRAWAALAYGCWHTARLLAAAPARVYDEALLRPGGQGAAGDPARDHGPCRLRRGPTLGPAMRVCPDRRG